MPCQEDSEIAIVVSISAAQQSDSAVHIETLFFFILFHDGLSQDVECSSLHSIVYPFYIQESASVDPELPGLLSPTPCPLASTNLFSMSVSLIIWI